MILRGYRITRYGKADTDILDTKDITKDDQKAGFDSTPLYELTRDELETLRAVESGAAKVVFG